MIPLVVPYEVGGRRERLVYLSREGDLRRTRSCARGSRQPSRTSCGHRWPGSSPCSRRRRSRARTSTALVEQARERSTRSRELIDEVLFLRELESGARVVALGATPVRPVLEEASASSRSARRGRASRSCSGATTTSSSRSGRACSAWSRGTSRRTRSATQAPARPSRSRWSGRDVVDPERTRRRHRHRGSGAPAPVRALLPRRPGSGVARHRARAGDREARRHAGGRLGRGPRGRGEGSRCVACSPRPEFTGSSPHLHHASPSGPAPAR